MKGISLNHIQHKISWLWLREHDTEEAEISLSSLQAGEFVGPTATSKFCIRAAVTGRRLVAILVAVHGFVFKYHG